ncbi:MAG TPA: hypothetical protein VG755_20545 [Nannocystaceae bacterium]|nr:hypothetical protein [Nannocystaceae bacterium]
MRVDGAGCWLVVAVMAGCGPDVGVDAGAGGSTSTSSTGTTTHDTSSTSTSSESSTSTSTSGDALDTSTSGALGCPFLCPPDLGSHEYHACDQWAQNCPRGEKCIPFAIDGDWVDAHCVPIADEPAAVGEPCIVEGTGASSTDDCDAGAMCYKVDWRTGQGTCFETCQGSESTGSCSGPSSQCIVAEAVPIVCLPICDPILQDCDEGDACLPLEDAFGCLIHAMGPTPGGYGQPCEFANVCDPGLFCDEPNGVPDCMGPTGCCNAFCDLGVPDPDAGCPGAAQGQTCVAWFALGRAPPGLSDVGRCTVTP